MATAAEEEAKVWRSLLGRAACESRLSGATDRPCIVIIVSKSQFLGGLPNMFAAWQISLGRTADLGHQHNIIVVVARQGDYTISVFGHERGELKSPRTVTQSERLLQISSPTGL